MCPSRILRGLINRPAAMYGGDTRAFALLFPADARCPFKRPFKRAGMPGQAFQPQSLSVCTVNKM